jgi:hypothetical protein
MATKSCAWSSRYDGVNSRQSSVLHVVYRILSNCKRTAQFLTWLRRITCKFLMDSFHFTKYKEKGSAVKRWIMRKIRDFRKICWTRNNIMCTDALIVLLTGRLRTDCVTLIPLLGLRMSRAHVCTRHRMKGNKSLRIYEHVATNNMIIRLKINEIFTFKSSEFLYEIHCFCAQILLSDI